MDELRDRVASAKVFTKLDLKDGYDLIRMSKGDEHKTAFRTRYRQYKYKVMPFGPVNAPATFQTMMNKILREFLDQRVVVYLDEILIDSEHKDNHIKLVEKVLAWLEQHDLAVLLKKSVFHQAEHQQKIYSSSCASAAEDGWDTQDVNSHSGCDDDPTTRPEDSRNVPLRPDKVRKRALRPVSPDTFRR